MAKLDLKKELKELYRPPRGKVSFVDVPVFNFLMIDGAGDPNTSVDFQAAMGALYAVSYTAKFAVKKQATDQDYVVMPLEGLWWTDGVFDFLGNKDEWRWKVMIAQPQQVTREVIDQAIEQAANKVDVDVLARLRFEPFREGMSAQTMHMGPYSEEGPTVELLHSAIAGEGYVPTGRHHEIYLSDPRRAKPENMKTILRQPVRPVQDMRQ